MTLFETWHSNYPILFWANKNGHKRILDYYFNEFSKDLSSFGLQKIHLAILCFKNIEECLTLAEIQTQVNLPANALGTINLFGPTPSESLSPLILAAKINHMQAVVMLCNQPANLVNLTDNSGLNALDHAIQQGNIEIAAYLLNKGATLDPVKYFTVDNLFEELDDNSKQFLYQQPTMLVEAMKLKYDNTLASRFIKNADTAYKSDVDKWLSTPSEDKDNILNNLRDYFKHHPVGNSNWERGIYALAQQIISSDKKELPALLENILREISDRHTVQEFKISLANILKTLTSEAAPLLEHRTPLLR